MAKNCKHDHGWTTERGRKVLRCYHPPGSDNAFVLIDYGDHYVFGEDEMTWKHSNEDRYAVGTVNHFSDDDVPQDYHAAYTDHPAVAGVLWVRTQKEANTLFIEVLGTIYGFEAAVQIA